MMVIQRPYRIMLAISEQVRAEAWLQLALRMLPENGEIWLRGLITIPEDRSLSEGALTARQMRDTFDGLAQVYPRVRAENWVSVDYQPLKRVLADIREDFPVDLLLVEWLGPKMPTGGLSTDAILEQATCDVCLICGDQWQHDGPVLLSLRGGPNLSLGLNVARGLSPASTISLFHANAAEESPDLQPLLGQEGGIKRVVTVRSEADVAAGILGEAIGHKAIIMGASFFKADSDSQASGRMVETIFERTRLPVALVRARQPEDIGFHKPRFLFPSEDDSSTRVDRWFAENTFDSEEFADLKTLMSWKERQGVTISLGLPALNEEETVGGVISNIKSALMDDVPLIDEIVLIDSDSTDNTVQIAQDCGVPVYKHPEVLKEEGTVRGKGEALWKSLHVLKGDIIAWIDTDIKNIHPRFVYGIIGPLLKHSHIQYVKGFYNRPIMVGNQLQAYGGGRVTELVARPLLNLFYPELSGVVQPLAGEYAGRRTALERVPFFSGYGVETGLLIDLHDLFGLDAIAQTNLNERVHHNQALVGLSKMSFAILQVFISRLENRYGVHLLDHANRSMKLITQTPERFALDVNEIGDVERPPMISIDAYKELRKLP